MLLMPQSLGFLRGQALKSLSGADVKTCIGTHHKKCTNAMRFGIVPTPFRTENQQQRAERLRSLIRLAVDFGTWSRLKADGLDDAAAADLMTQVITAQGIGKN